MDLLENFDRLTEQWFIKTLGSPTKVQELAWPAISKGRHTLVSAPTGTGKTLSAFLVFIDQLKEQSRAGTLKKELQLIYISPLKSLAGDIRENLRRPLNGISEEERNEGVAAENTPFDINVSIRTGDTTQNERRKMIKSPPHILITTPESLYLMLSSRSGQSILKTARAVIIDELHALIGSKRGAHLMLSIARLDKLCSGPLQRIGLSATIEPLDLAAEYLSPDMVECVAPKMEKKIEIKVTSPLPQAGLLPNGSIWPDIASSVYDQCIGVRSAIAFVEGRLFAEKLAYYVNEIGGKGFARTHHGSLSKERRMEVEQALRDGELKLLCATSSMELGIDVGNIDRVLQIGCPRSISSTMQRLGRAGHNPGRVSIMHIFPRTAPEGLYCGLTAKVAKDGGVEHSRPPRLCLDVLAQHLVSMATGDGYHLDEVMEILPRAYPFCNVTKEDVKGVLQMLAGDYEHERDIPVRPRILYDRIHDRVDGDAYSRMLAISTGGTIPDRGLYAVKTENGVKIGELDEEFVFEARVGDKFLLGTFGWKITNIEKDNVFVAQSNIEGATPPFWKGDWSGRGIRTGLAFGEIFRSLINAHEKGTLYQALCDLGLDEAAAKNAQSFLMRQIESTGILPNDRTILIEHFIDDVGEHQMMIHSMFGRQVNAPLAILAQIEAKRQTGMDVGFFDDDYGILLFPYGEKELPQKLLYEISPESARPVLEALLPATPLFNMAFRYNAARALMMGVRKAGRQPLWVQRLRGAEMLDSLIEVENHPLVRETKRECIEDYWDLTGVEFVLKAIQSGEIQIREVFLDAPSPMSLPLRRQAEATLMYEYSPTPSTVHHAVEEALKQTQAIPPDPEELTRMHERTKLPEDENQLHSLLMIEGDLIAGELDVPLAWLELLAHQERVAYIEPGLWIAFEHSNEYSVALNDHDMEAKMHIVRRALRYREAQTAEQIAKRYFWAESDALEVLCMLCQQEMAVENDGLFYHAKLYSHAQRETVKNRRRQIKTLPPERYAALLANRIRKTAPSDEQLEASLTILRDIPYPPALWEGTLLPARVKGYTPQLLDAYLAKGMMFWNMNQNTGLSFHMYEDIDWDAEMPLDHIALEENEKIIYEALLKRGASFVQGLPNLSENISLHDTMMTLTEKGLIHADSFAPIRQFLNKKKTNKSSVRQHVHSRVKTLTAGRWDISRPLEKTLEKLLEDAFDRAVILCRETAQNLSWGQALETLRLWEYTGRVRRGYFIEGLSGAQFIREKDFNGTLRLLEQPQDQIIWMSAADPDQPWGKLLSHKKDRSFLNVPGTAVALRAGEVIAVFERQGQVLRVFDHLTLIDAVCTFAEEFKKRHIFTLLNRLTVKQYPDEAMKAFEKAGFSKQMQDYVLYRGYS